MARFRGEGWKPSLLLGRALLFGGPGGEAGDEGPEGGGPGFFIHGGAGAVDEVFAGDLGCCLGLGDRDFVDGGATGNATGAVEGDEAIQSGGFGVGDGEGAEAGGLRAAVVAKDGDEFGLAAEELEVVGGVVDAALAVQAGMDRFAGAQFVKGDGRGFDGGSGGGQGDGAEQRAEDEGRDGGAGPGVHGGKVRGWRRGDEAFLGAGGGLSSPRLRGPGRSRRGMGC